MSAPLIRGGADARALSTPRLVQTARGPVELIDVGHGPAVLALHGGMGGCDQSLLLARAALGDAAPRRVLALSRPGYLGTPTASGPTPEAQADLYATLLDALGIDGAVAVAVSAGGPSALHFALRHPSRCRSLVLVSCCTGTLAIPPQVRQRLPMMRWIARLPWLVALMRRRALRDPDKAAERSIRDSELRARTLADPIAGPMLKQLQASVFDRMAQRLPGTLADTSTFEAMPAIDVAPLQPPLLAIHGTADQVVSFAHAARVAQQARRGELMAVDGGEHVALFTHQEAVRSRIGQFLSAN